MASPAGSNTSTKPPKASDTLSTAKAGTSPGETAAGTSTMHEPKRSPVVKSSVTKRKSDFGKPNPIESKNPGPKKKVKKPEGKDDFTEFRGRLDKLESLMERMVEFLPCPRTSANLPTGDTPPTAAENVSSLEHRDDDFEPFDLGIGNMGQCPGSYDIGSMDDGDYTETVAPVQEQEKEDEVPALAQKFAIPTGVGSAIHNDLAKSAMYLMSHQLEENTLEEAGGKYPPPSNYASLCCPKVNAAIWENLSSHTRSRDLKLQRIQKPLTRGLTAFIQTLTPDSLSETQQNALALLCNANFEVNCLRKEQIKPDLNAKYSHLCKPTTPVSQYLFGDDLTKRVKDLTEQQKAAAGVVRGQRKTRPQYHPYRTQAPGTNQYRRQGWNSATGTSETFASSRPPSGNYNRSFLGQRTQQGRAYRAPPHTQTMSMQKQTQSSQRPQAARRK